MAVSDASDRRILPPPTPYAVGPTAIDLRRQDPPYRPTDRLKAPDGAPNVVVVLVDDMGFGASAAFGGPCEMPVAERLAERGLRYSRFHTTAICSASRAALLTGRNHHSVGYGTVVELAMAAPGYNARRPASAATLARTLCCNGYATGAFGKMHQTPYSDVTASGPYDRWPTADGFEKFYGFLAGEISQWYPALFDGTTPIDAPRLPSEGYHLSEDIVDNAINWIRDLKTTRRGTPFFCHVSFGATHAPFHVSPSWVDKYRGRFEHGWDVQREITLARQQEIGVVPAGAQLAPWAPNIPRWNDLSKDQREAACLLMELYAGFADHMDAQVGRLIEALEDDGELDNTLIFYILGDNGASAEGGLEGTVNTYIGLNGARDCAENVLASKNELGSPETWPHYPVGWALAMDTPYQWMKQVASHYGGTRNGLIVHWPRGIHERGGIRHQWHHIIDVSPTVLEAAGFPEPSIVDGVVQQPIEGTSMLYSFNESDAADRHVTQYFEMGGSRGIYHRGWVACTPHRTAPWDMQVALPDLRDDVWELYNTSEDWTQAQDLAASDPAMLAELQDLFLLEASRYNVLPLDDRPLAVKASETASDRGGAVKSMTFHAHARRLPQDVVPWLLNCSHTIEAEIVIPANGARGVVCAQGGRTSGWSLYCDASGLLTYCHNAGTRPFSYVRSAGPLTAGTKVIRYDFDYDGGGLGKGGMGRLYVDDVLVGESHISRTIAFLFTLGEGFNVGKDPYMPITDEYAPRDNAFTGEVRWVRIDVDHLAGDPDHASKRVAVAQAVQ